jgi:endoglucanase
MNETEILDLLQELCNAIGVSGYEDDVRAIVQKRIAAFGYEIRTDALGNLIALRKSSRPGAPVLMLDAHLDEIGLVISYIEPSGFLRFATIGGWDERVLPAHSVTVRTRGGKYLRGVLGVPPPHIQREGDKNKPYPAESLFIDIGARSSDEVKELGVRVGDSATLYYPFTVLESGAVIGKSLDNRVGCAAQIAVMQALVASGEDLPVTIAAVFSTFEEIGGRGAKVAASSVAPDIALVFEGTVAGDFPGVPEARCPSAQGKGPAITIMDRTMHCAPKVVELLESLAEREEIPYQFKTPIFGGTDGARIHISRGGVLTGVLSTPCRYIHSPHAMMRMEDFMNTIRLATAFARECAVLVEPKS